MKAKLRTKMARDKFCCCCWSSLYIGRSRWLADKPAAGRIAAEAAASAGSADIGGGQLFRADTNY